MGFDVTEWEQVIDTVSNSILQLIFKKLPLVGIWSITEYPQVLLTQPSLLLFDDLEWGWGERSGVHV